MKCYNCGRTLAGENTCVDCAADVSVYKKIIYTSNLYYNIALEKARVRDLTGAVDYLKRSIHMNKENSAARNLLGLIYFEIGDVVDALSQWVISKNMDPVDNQADEYIDKVQKDETGLELINTTIKKYNIALEYAKQGNDDLAVIQLKKILNTNPKCIKGHQLLALLFIKNLDYENARKALKKSLKIDTTNTQSLSYLKEVEGKLEKKEESFGILKKKKTKKIFTKEEKETKSLSGNDVIIPSGYKETNFGATTILYIIIGILIGAAMVFFLVTPAKNRADQAENIQKILELEEDVANLTTKNKDLANEVESLNNENLQYKEKVDLDTSMQTSYDALITAFRYYQNGNYLPGADEIIKIKSTEGMSQTFLDMYNQIYGPLSNTGANHYYNLGMSQYYGRNYDGAIENLLIAFEFNKENANTLLNIAIAYNDKGDIENATKYFMQVVELFPGTSQERRANEYLNP